jgi:uncharacterized circularly permuted ATP-grasp superfamily protein/uncharacterized alpha-E superfamily protein
MSNPSSETLVNAHAALAHYHVPSLAYDELGRGQLPGHWRQVMDFFTAPGDLAESPQPEHLRSEMLVRDLDVQRPTRLDPLPFTLPASEWRQIEQGLTQRARLLNQITADLYGPKTLLNVGGLPPALVFGNPRFLLPMYDYRTTHNEYLHLLAFDIGRSPDGQWRVLADWTEAPEGLGICLENRVLSGQALPELFQQLRTPRLAAFFRAFAQHLTQRAGETTPEGITVIMSPGPDHPNYFEHAYLGQYFGFPVVEGADLTVRGQTLHLKTLEGLKPVGSVIRHAQATRCDQLYLEPHTSEGVAGLANISRSGHAHIANALGSGVLENDAFMSFLPSLCQSLLNEDLLFPSLATWWCGQPEEQAYVANNKHQLHIGAAFKRPELFASAIEGYQTAQHNDQGTEPYTQVGRELINLSHSPYVNDLGQIVSGPTVLRLFVGLTGNGYRLMPGGIARVATADGEVSKDIWVSADAVTQIEASSVSASSKTRRSDRDLPSRTADDLFWLGRYLERCEGAVRAYRCLFSHVSNGSTEDQQMLMQTVVQLLVDLDMISLQQARQLTQSSSTTVLAREWWSVLFDPSNNVGLFKLLANIYRLASQVRERLSGDAWRMFKALSQTPQEQRWRLGNVSDALALMDQLIERLSGLNGQIQENMTRSYGWRLLELGRRLERGQFGLQVMEELVNHTSSGTYMYLLLDLCDSAITYRARYQNTPVLEDLLHLLLLDDTNPRSMIYQISQLQNVMAEMPLDQNNDGLSESQQILLVAYHELILADPHKLANVVSKAGNRTQLRRVLKRLDVSLAKLSELMTNTYFAHTQNTPNSQ